MRLMSRTLKNIKMKKLTSLFLAAALCAVFQACSSKAIASQLSQKEITASATLVNKEISIRTFNKIDVSLGNVNVTVGQPTGSLKISAPDNLMQYIEISSQGSTLKICRKDNVNIHFAHHSKPVTITVSTPLLTEIDASLSAHVNVTGQNSADEIDLDATTSASITFENIVSESLDAEASTSGSIKIANAMINGNADIEVSTSGSVTIENANISGKTDIESSTSGNTKIAMLKTDRLKADASTSSSVKAAGTARKVNLTGSTSGSISCGDLKAETGDASASTGGHVSCNIKSPGEISSSLGGSVKNKND